MTEYFHPAFPKLYRIGGEYAPGLARLFGMYWVTLVILFLMTIVFLGAVAGFIWAMI